ncbi:hypothetical protein SAMN04488523_1257 [Sulfitobacter brevis]|uniref:Uncharacterized protein n=1 Tax=Sulfitobacter brevis TaxID=74348 RepID=A0A1I2GKH0_9RHOB|nr:hypothetical protein [Sulfitobacter brevis]SFF17101.1 hypothetical protein SAMN04488523_1257 [Sulfitobacter brevis]
MDDCTLLAPRQRRNAVANFMPRRIKRVSRSLGYCLLLDDLDAWLGLTTILRARLSSTERAALAYVGLKALPPHEAQRAAEAALGATTAAGHPIAALLNHIDEAAFWADMATPDEHEAYCLASFKAMPNERQSAFLNFVQGRQAA